MSSLGINVGALLVQLGVFALVILLLVGGIWFAVRVATRASGRRTV